MYGGYQRQGDAYPLHLKNYISQCRDAERRRAAMTPSLQANLTPNHNVRPPGTPQSVNHTSWSNHILPPNSNPQDYKPFVPMYNVHDQGGSSTYVPNNEQPTVPQPQATYNYEDNNSATLGNHQQPEPEPNYNANNSQPPVYQYNFVINPQDAAQPYYLIPNSYSVDNEVVNNSERILLGSFSIRVPRSLEALRGLQENLRREYAATTVRVNNTDAQGNTVHYEYTPANEHNMHYARPNLDRPPMPSPFAPARGIVIHCNGLVKYGNRTVGMIDPDVLRITNHFIYDPETMAIPIDDPQAPAEEQRYEPNVSHTADDVRNVGGPSLVRPRYEDTNAPDYAENHPAAKRPRLDNLDSPGGTDPRPQQTQMYHNQVITVEDDDDDNDTHAPQTNYVAFDGGPRHNSNNAEESDDDGNSHYSGSPELPPAPMAPRSASADVVYSSSASASSSASYASTSAASSCCSTPNHPAADAAPSPGPTVEEYPSTNATYSSTSAPFSSTNAPFSSAPAPFSSTNAPCSATSGPFSSASAPCSSATAPFSSTSAPSSATSAPYSSTRAPSSATSAPFSSTRAPSASVTAPSASMIAPFSSARAPSASTSAPSASTSAPSASTSAQFAPTRAPTASTSAPSSSTAPTESRTSSPDAYFVIPTNMQFLFDSDRFRRLYILYKLSAVKKVDDRDLGEKCVICLIDFEIGQTTLALRCGHKFHDNCIYMWCTSAATCPMCRRDIVDETICENFPNRLLQNLEFIRYCLVRRRCIRDQGGLNTIAENDEADAPARANADDDVHIID